MKTKLIVLAVLVIALITAFRETGEKNVRIFMIGDSTMANKAPEKAPETGWGMVFGDFFNEQVTIENHAVNGRSSKSFIGEGRWQKVYNQLQPGDYVFIQFGHNDQKDQSPDRFTNPFTTYRANLERFVRESREKGAIPILLTSVVRRNFNEKGSLIDTHGNYPLVVRMVASDLDVPFIDLQLLTEQKMTDMGPEESKKLYLWLEAGENANYPNGVQDNTHFCHTGATEVASMVVGELKKLHLLEEYLKK
ncbi:rhamnogalacturonan acetylesterase [Gaoshiqia sediminis]|uniref:Rhamnogalacturonan acetylesterase n=1 Tax=Gaoshiqia sediminis TaxID=2986998 RepID=A0AA41Y9Z8_9BACT|nr:rhamnogalacturonan acetylesterase [Gaoshiqia sediminis]MCW0484376.1 rhamnogalacturonan acetylesterase [Gaoshiqia sediminis]